jgi:epoxyqueuosine reductase
VLGENYGPASDPRASLVDPTRGTISVYARGGDYHEVMKKRLKELAHWLAETEHAEVKLFVDTAPVMEKPLAQWAGIGWQGRHTNLVSRSFGSWLFLGEIFTTLDLPPDEAERDHCGSCRDCEPVCPTGALSEGRIEPRLCISYLTIEHKGHIPSDLRPKFGNRIYGCDDCLAVCPWNRFAREGKLMKTHDRPDLQQPDLLELLQLDDATFKTRFAHSPILRTKRRGFLRNVCVALGNTATPAALPRLAQAARDPEPLIAEHAQWAIGQIEARS